MMVRWDGQRLPMGIADADAMRAIRASGGNDDAHR